jgi:lysophospholipase L1-like esterase
LQCVAIALPLTISVRAWADDLTALRDVNGDGSVRILAFGDSITYGVGNAFQPGEFVESMGETGDKGGYPDRIERYLGVPVYNEGVPGEQLTVEGVERFPRKLVGSNFDVAIIMEGTNDASQQTSAGQYARGLQRMINVGVADGKQIVVMTVLPPVAYRDSIRPFTQSYSRAGRDLARVNGVPLIDVEQAITDTCPILDKCRFYNLPEGLHPNRRGYDALAQIVAAGLLGIDVTAPGSAAQISSALGLPQNDVIVGN